MPNTLILVYNLSSIELFDGFWAGPVRNFVDDGLSLRTL